jgi:enamine deaminase RidA (YjgF/YER057c/UK114 family)
VTFRRINPDELGVPSGWTNGMLAPAGGRVLFVAGQDAANADGEVVTDDFVEQFDIALRKILTVVRQAGGDAESIGRMTVFVTDIAAYLASRSEIGAVWRSHMDRHFPAMALMEVSGLVDGRAKLEIEATAVLDGTE